MRAIKTGWVATIGSLSLFGGIGSAAAEAGDFLVHSTVIGVFTDASSSSALLDLDIDDAQSVAIDGTYFITNNIGVNVLATFLNFDVTTDSAVVQGVASENLGSVDLLPPIVSVQYHFTPDAPAFRPYVGAGFNYNIFSDESGHLDDLNVDVEDTIGWVVGAGFDYTLAKNVSLNADIKYLTFDADVDVGAAPALNDELEVDAWIIGVGLGFRF